MIRNYTFYSLLILFLLFFVKTTSWSQQCTLGYQQTVSANTVSGYAHKEGWRLQNQSSGCYASNYYLVPQSAQISYNNGGTWYSYSGMNTVFYRNSGPNQSNTGQSNRFSCSAWNTVDVKVNFNVSPSQSGYYRMYFDIYDSNGNVLPLPSGWTRLYTEFYYTVPSCNIPTNTHEDNLATTSVKLDWYAPSNTSVSNYQVRIRPSGGSWSYYYPSSSSQTVTGLSSGSTYQWEVRTDCGSTNSSYTSTETFTTLTSCNIPTNTHEDNLATTSVKLDWYAPSNTSVSNYQVRIRPSGGSWSYYYPSSSSQTVTGLSSGSTYQWEVRTDCGSTNSSYTSTETFTTLTSCNIPTNTHEDNLATTSVNLDWYAPSNTSVSNYQVRIRPSGGSWSYYYPSSSSQTVTGLSSGSTYQWEVRTDCGSTNSSYTSTETFTTLTSCGIPTNTHEDNLATTSVSLDWYAPSNTSVSNYQVRIRPSGGSWSYYYPSSSSQTVTGLSSGSTYQWEVRTDCGSTNSNYTSTETFTTCSSVLANFSYSTYEVMQGNSITFYNSSNGASSYSWSFQNGSPNSSSSTNPTITFNSLGIKQIQLTSYNSCGQNDIETKTIKVIPNPNPNVNPPPANSVSVNSPVNQNPGDPVDVATGAFTWMQLDMSISGRNGDYALVRYYNAQDSYNGSMGYGWSHSFDINLMVSGNNWTVKHGDGHSDYYIHYNDGSTLPMYAGVTDTMYQSSSNYILEKDNGIKYTFNSSGVLQNITDRNNNTTLFTYTSGNLSRVTFPGGRYFDFAYSGSRISTITDNTSRSVSYTYDGNGDMTQFTDMDNGVYQYAYTNHEMISVKDPKVNTIIQNTYVSNKVTQQVDAAGGIFTFQYNTPVTNASTVTDAEGKTAIYYHDNAYRLIKKTDELGNNSLFEFNENNQFTKITNENNDVVNISHDYKGNVKEIDAPLNTKTSSSYNAQNVPEVITNAANEDINITYDANANPINMAFPNGSSLASTYNSFGQLLTQTDGNGNQISFQYNNTTGDLSSITTSTGTYNFGYDNLGRITSVTDRNGKQTQMQLDKFGNITKVTDPMNYFIELTYDANGNILTFKDKNSVTTNFTYDNKDRMTKVTDGEGNQTNFTYDLMDRLITVTDAENRTVNYSYDNKGRMISYTTALGTYSFGYDNVGNRISVTDALNNTTNITYDKLNRPISIQNALNETVIMTYNALGQVKSFQDAGGNLTNYEYNDMGWLTKVKDAASGENNFTYDPNGNMLTFNDANGNTTTMTYNDQNLPITQLNGANHLTKMYYDNEGNLVGKVDANGDSTGLVLNDNYLVTQLAFSNGNNYQYAYDNNGALSSMTNTNGTTSFTRNLLGLMTQTQDPFGNITKFIYDKVGNRTGTIYSGTDTVNIEYNAANLPTKVKDWAGNYSNRTYDANGSLTNITNSNGTYTNIVRDALGRVETYANFQPGNVLINSDTLTYNNIGNITRRGRHAQLSPTFANLTDSYTHGNDNRLVSTSNGTITNDDNGAWTNNGQGETYTWGENSLLKSYTNNGVTTQNFHDAGRNLIKEVKSGVETRFQLDNSNSLSQVLRELDDQNNVTASYIHAPDGLSWRLDNQNNAQFYAYDYLGHTNALTDENGNITDTYAADPFGDFTNHVGSTVQPFQFLGKYGIQHKGNGHYHIRARDYSGSTGTFISQDAYPMSIVSTQLVNKYAYAVNNSMSFMDINGFYTKSIEVVSKDIRENGFNKFLEYYDNPEYGSDYFFAEASKYNVPSEGWLGVLIDNYNPVNDAFQISEWTHDLIAPNNALEHHIGTFLITQKYGYDDGILIPFANEVRGLIINDRQNEVMINSILGAKGNAFEWSDINNNIIGTYYSLKYDGAQVKQKLKDLGNQAANSLNSATNNVSSLWNSIFK